MVDAVIGIDPGANGAAVLLYPDAIHNSVRFKSGWRFVSDNIQSWARTNWTKAKLVVGIENVHAFGRDDVSTAFTFGQNTGIIHGILYAHNIPFELIEPKAWQREFNLGGKYPDQPTRKRAHKAKAQELFPDIKVTLDLADALLIALYMHRKTFGGLTGGIDTTKPKREGVGIKWGSSI